MLYICHLAMVGLACVRPSVMLWVLYRAVVERGKSPFNLEILFCP